MKVVVGAFALYALIVLCVSSAAWAMAHRLPLRSFLAMELGTIYGLQAVLAVVVIRSR